MDNTKTNTYAIWVITPNGVRLASKLARGLSGADQFISDKLSGTATYSTRFHSLSETVEKKFYQYNSHIFIMATGIVVRMIAPFIRSKIEDPAVVVVDDQGNHAISLLSGHLGGANALSIQVAELIEAEAVITTASDVNQIRAIDILAKDRHLYIENPKAIKTVNMALLRGDTIRLHDPFGVVKDLIPNSVPWPEALKAPGDCNKERGNTPSVFIDDKRVDLLPEILILRPQTLIAGIGCNRNTDMQEIKDLLESVLEQFQLSDSSLAGIASIDLKAEEPGLLALAKELNSPLFFFEKEELNQVTEIMNPSDMVEKHVGVKSVCEAAAIIATQGGPLVIPKQTSRNATVAIARMNYTS